MNNEIIYFILFIIIIIIYNKKNKKKKEIIINTIIKPLNPKKQIKPNQNFYNYKIININEKGGSKLFNNIVINNDNLTANQVNYYKYESYRKKPHKQIKVY